MFLWREDFAKIYNIRVLQCFSDRTMHVAILYGWHNAVSFDEWVTGGGVSKNVLYGKFTS